MSLIRSLALALALTGCTGYAPVVPWPQPPPAPVEPPPAPTEPPVDPLPPGAAQEALDAIAIGATLAEATTAVGRAPVLVAGTARWFGEGWMVYAVVHEGKVARKGVVTLQENP